jgi:AcrR family transcriptional regulator
VVDDAQLLWTGPTGRRRRGAHPALDRARIVRAGMAIADAEGLERLSMQRVADRLGSAPMSLYRHVPGKAALIGLMFDAALGAPPAPERGGWRTVLSGWARANRAVFAAHPWLLPLAPVARTMGPNELAWTEAGLAALTGTGLSPADRLEVLLLVSTYVRGEAVDIESGPVPPELEALRRWGQLERFPLFVAALHESGLRESGLRESGLRDSGRVPDHFEFGLARLIDGIASLLDAGT